MKTATKVLKHLRRKKRVRSQISGSATRPRLSVFRSNQGVYAQLIDDSSGKTIASASSLKSKSKNMDAAAAVGKELAAAGLKAGIESCVFDRNGYKYHGKIKALADAAREAGLKF